MLASPIRMSDLLRKPWLADHLLDLLARAECNHIPFAAKGFLQMRTFHNYRTSANLAELICADVSDRFCALKCEFTLTAESRLLTEKSWRLTQLRGAILAKVRGYIHIRDVNTSKNLEVVMVIHEFKPMGEFGGALFGVPRWFDDIPMVRQLLNSHRTFRLMRPSLVNSEGIHSQASNSSTDSEHEIGDYRSAQIQTQGLVRSGSAATRAVHRDKKQLSSPDSALRNPRQPWRQEVIPMSRISLKRKRLHSGWGDFQDLTYYDCQIPGTQQKILDSEECWLPKGDYLIEPIRYRPCTKRVPVEDRGRQQSRLDFTPDCPSQTSGLTTSQAQPLIISDESHDNQESDSGVSWPASPKASTENKLYDLTAVRRQFVSNSPPLHSSPSELASPRRLNTGERPFIPPAIPDIRSRLQYGSLEDDQETLTRDISPVVQESKVVPALLSGSLQRSADRMPYVDADDVVPSYTRHDSLKRTEQISSGDVTNDLDQLILQASNTAAESSDSATSEIQNSKRIESRVPDNILITEAEPSVYQNDHTSCVIPSTRVLPVVQADDFVVTEVNEPTDRLSSTKKHRTIPWSVTASSDNLQHASPVPRSSGAFQSAPRSREINSTPMNPYDIGRRVSASPKPFTQTKQVSRPWQAKSPRQFISPSTPMSSMKSQTELLRQSGTTAHRSQSQRTSRSPDDSLKPIPDPYSFAARRTSGRLQITTASRSPSAIHSLFANSRPLATSEAPDLPASVSIDDAPILTAPIAESTPQEGQSLHKTESRSDVPIITSSEVVSHGQEIPLANSHQRRVSKVLNFRDSLARLKTEDEGIGIQELLKRDRATFLRLRQPPPASSHIGVLERSNDEGMMSSPPHRSLQTPKANLVTSHVHSGKREPEVLDSQADPLLQSRPLGDTSNLTIQTIPLDTNGNLAEIDSVDMPDVHETPMRKLLRTTFKVRNPQMQQYDVSAWKTRMNALDRRNREAER